MGKQKKLAAAVRMAANMTKPEPMRKETPRLKLGDHTFRDFDGIDASFGAKRSDYPSMADVPSHQLHRSFESVASKLFFRGGKLDDFGLSFKPGIDRIKAMTAIRSLMNSFEPQHEHKMAVVAWALREWCNGTPVHID